MVKAPKNIPFHNSPGWKQFAFWPCLSLRYGLNYEGCRFAHVFQTPKSRTWIGLPVTARSFGSTNPHNLLSSTAITRPYRACAAPETFFASMHGDFFVDFLDFPPAWAHRFPAMYSAAKANHPLIINAPLIWNDGTKLTNIPLLRILASQSKYVLSMSGASPADEAW